LSITTLELAPTKSRLDLGFEAQPRNRPRLHLAVLATMRPTLDSAGHQLPRTKPTCQLHTWRPHRPRPFALVLHLHQHQSIHNMRLQYLARSQSTPHCQSLITPGRDLPPVVEPHRLSITGCSKIQTKINDRYHSLGSQLFSKLKPSYAA
jgi:hypothetical protein